LKIDNFVGRDNSDHIVQITFP